MTTTSVDAAAAHVVLIAEGRQLAATGAGKMIREAAGVTLAEVAAACETDPAAVWRWEAGVHRPKGPFAARYAIVIGRLRDRHAPRGKVAP